MSVYVHGAAVSVFLWPLAIQFRMIFAQTKPMPVKRAHSFPYLCLCALYTRIKYSNKYYAKPDERGLVKCKHMRMQMCAFSPLCALHSECDAKDISFV